MRLLPFILCLVLLAPVWARAKNLAIGESSELAEHPDIDVEIKEYTLEELLKDSDSSRTGEEAIVSTGCVAGNFDDSRYTKEELLKDKNDADIESLLAAEANESVTDSTNEESVTTDATDINTGLNSTTPLQRILGGTAVTSGTYTYVVFVEGTTASATGTSKYCGGSILSVSWVLTAAQCVAAAAAVNVYAGVIEDPLAGTKTPASPIIHPGYLRNFMINDIALLRLLTPLTLSGTIGIVKLSTVSITGWDGVLLRTFGYGPSDDTTVLPDTVTLNYVDLKVVKKPTCLADTAETYVAYPGNTGCLSTSVATKGICFADAGGPVVYPSDADGSAKIVGINSQYLGCPSTYPSSFTLVQPFLNWIKAKTGKSFT